MERNDPFKKISVGLLAFSAGMWTSIGVRSCADETTKERIADIQEHNAQIEEQLEHDFPGIGRLVLNDETDTFEFHVSREQSSQTCTGKYSVGENREASVADDVTCSETIALGKN